MATVNLKVGGDGSVEPDGVECKCDKTTWPIVILCLGFGVSFLVVLLCVLSLMQLKDIVISVYIIVLSLLGLLAEFRRIKFLRGAIYHVVKYAYFLTGYYARGAYHIFIGTILFADVPLNIIAGCISIAFGLTLICVHLFVGLPIYVDWQVAKEEEEARAKRFPPGQTPLNAGTTYSVAPTPTAGAIYSPTEDYGTKQNYDTSTNPYDAPNAYVGQSNTQSSVSLHTTGTGSAAYIPSSSNTAYMANQTREDPYGEDPITAAPTSRARMQDDKSLAEAYYGSQQSAKAPKADPDDPFARDDNQYRPNRR